jgi:2-polyprenyl-3-methyl-5-hydroxy-6-metoxy-1,4-benzoquinol methylase
MDHAEWAINMKPGAWTTDNRSGLKRFSHSKRFEKAVELVDPEDGDKILDYGCSDGYLLELLKSTGINLRTCGYDPLWPYYAMNRKSPGRNRGIFITDDLDTFGKGAFNKITCLEVLEHLEGSSLKDCLLNIKNLLSKNGTVVVSVPIEVGVSSLLKNAVRIYFSQTHPNTNLITIAKSLLRLPVKRRGDGSYILSHIGFDYGRLESTFTEMGFEVIKRVFSPFSLLGPYVNSQVFYVIRVVTPGYREGTGVGSESRSSTPVALGKRF